jgi:hypothetical protein
MMKLKYLLLAMASVAVSALLFSACSNDNGGEDPITPTPTPSGSVKIAPAGVILPLYSGSAVFRVTTNDDWTVATTANWITLSPASGTGNGTFTVTVTGAGFSETDQTATLVVTSGAATVSASAIQYGVSQEIAGITWSRYYVGQPGKFTPTIEVTPETAVYYLWNNKTPFTYENDGDAVDKWITDELDWEDANNPCPTGWTLPTESDFKSLIESGYTAVSGNEDYKNVWNEFISTDKAGKYDLLSNVGNETNGIFFGPFNAIATWEDHQECIFFSLVGGMDTYSDVVKKAQRVDETYPFAAQAVGSDNLTYNLFLDGTMSPAARTVNGWVRTWQMTPIRCIKK